MPRNFDYDRTPAEIILACQDTGYELYDLGRFGDLYRNRDLISLFDGIDTLTIDEITPRFVEMKKADRYGEVFEARRAGEVIRWAVNHGLVERIVVNRQPAWRILDRQPHYMAIGPERNQRVIRIRGLRDPDAVKEAAKLERREMGRRKRADEKLVAARRAAIQHSLDILMRFQPYAPLPEELSRFAVEGCDYIRSYRDVLIDAASDPDERVIWVTLERMKIRAELARYEAEQAARKAAAEAPVVPDDDADAMGDIDF